MYRRTTDLLWEKRTNMPSCIDVENVSETILEIGLKKEEEETKFYIEHSTHGNVVLKHIHIFEQDVILSDEFRSWTRSDKADAINPIKYEYYLVCKTCHASCVVVDENTPDEFRGI